MKCPKCGNTSGDDWSQCGGKCPMSMSPHYTADFEPTQELKDFMLTPPDSSADASGTAVFAHLFTSGGNPGDPYKSLFIDLRTGESEFHEGVISEEEDDD